MAHRQCCSLLPCNVATLTNFLLNVNRPVVHGYSATVVCFVDTLHAPSAGNGQQIVLEEDGVICFGV